MRLLTLNAHNLTAAEEARLSGFVAGVLSLRPEVIALQEIGQRRDAPPAGPVLLAGCFPVQTRIPVRADNGAAHAAQRLRRAGLACHWAYLPMKRGYDRYDEGLALLSIGRRIRRAEPFLLSAADSYGDWRTRWALGVQLEGLPDWFFSVHMGWWQDEGEGFPAQWRRLHAAASEKARHAPVWLLGDFNAPAHQRGEGYDLMAADGWHDTFHEAVRRSGCATVPSAIDGWRGVRSEAAAQGMRIDMIWHAAPGGIASSRVVFRGDTEAVVSDHYGVLVRTEPHRP